MQQLLVIGAIIILGTLILTFNRSTQNTNSINYDNIAMIDGAAAAQSLIEEIEMKAFDERTVSATVTATSGLTAASLLGPESGETGRTTFDDIDDYNNFQGVDSFKHFDAFTFKVRVYYVTSTSPSSSSSTQTFLKKIDVDVYNANLTDTLSLTRIVGY